ncbi:putative holin-like toxin [Cohnella endophytica]|uniref:putative holin-like toxin n=1 Tax=Cohnella endophytica TaxID=2419778 RepID=UPI002D767CBF|nr:putative holin-like toxin [Cohnella endophytica]
MLNPSKRKIVPSTLPILTKKNIMRIQLVSGEFGTHKKEEHVMDVFQSLTIMFAFGVFILTLLSYMDKRK